MFNQPIDHEEGAALTEALLVLQGVEIERLDAHGGAELLGRREEADLQRRLQEVLVFQNHQIMVQIQNLDLLSKNRL